MTQQFKFGDHDSIACQSTTQLADLLRLAIELNSPEYHVFIVSTRSRPKAAEASSETLATQGFYSPKSPKSPKKAQSEYSTAFSRHTRFAKFLIVKESSRFANLPAF